MFKTWSFWKTFFAICIPLIVWIWGFVQAYTYFKGDSLKHLFSSDWWIYYYVVPFLMAILFTVSIHSSTAEKAETLDQYNRRVMLNHVEFFWIKGVLEKSLHGVALLELGKKEDPNMIDYPWKSTRTF